VEILKPSNLHSINSSVESDVYLFNASNDSALACNNLSYSPTKFVKVFENDLATLPMLFATEYDIVLVNEQPSEDFISQLQKFGFKLPHFVTKDDFFEHQQSLKYNLRALKPWGWSRTVHTIFRTVKNQFTKTTVCSDWNPQLRELSGRQTAATILQTIVEQKLPFVLSESAIPKPLKSVETIPQLFSQNERWVLKAPWSSSGRGLMRISPQRYDKTEQTWAQGIIDEQGFVMIEPWHDKVFDFSMLFSVTADAISLLCFSSFKTNDKGQFLGSYINWHEHSVFAEMGITEIELNNLACIVAESLRKCDFQNYYEGWIGVDAMVIRENGKVVIHPCVEINCRYTIGHLAYVLQQYFEPSSNALLRIGSLQEYQDTKTTIAVQAITPITQKAQFVGWIEL
jgi:hypothetical protein